MHKLSHICHTFVTLNMLIISELIPKNTRCDNVTTRVDENKKGMHFQND